jgi:hypothetical protein
VLTLYGRDGDSRTADPLDARRVFSWLICETRDDKGNAVLYRYKAEDGLGVELDRAHERNRGPTSDSRRTANRYLKRIQYGNRPPLDNMGQRPVWLRAGSLDHLASQRSSTWDRLRPQTTRLVALARSAALHVFWAEWGVGLNQHGQGEA